MTPQSVNVKSNVKRITCAYKGGGHIRHVPAFSAVEGFWAPSRLTSYSTQLTTLAALSEPTGGSLTPEEWSC